MIPNVYHHGFNHLASQLQLPGLAPHWTEGAGSTEAVILCITAPPAPPPVPRRICLVKTCRMNERRGEYSPAWSDASYQLLSISCTWVCLHAHMSGDREGDATPSVPQRATV